MLRIKEDKPKYKIGDCVYFNELSGIIDSINIQKTFVQYGIEKYYPDGFHLAGWNWISEKDICGLVDDNKKNIMQQDYIKVADEHIKKGYPKERFRLYDLIKADMVERI